MSYQLEYAHLGAECGFAVVDHDRRIANYTTYTEVIKSGAADRVNWRTLAIALIREEAHWICTGARPTDYHSVTGWLAYSASRGVSTETFVWSGV